MTTERTTIAVAIAVVRSGDRFLIGQRPAGSKLAGLWEFPGGKVESGESPRDAAVRECLEETTLDVEIVGEYPGRIQSYDHGTVELSFFDCQPVDPNAVPTPGYRWIDRVDLPNYAFPTGNNDLLALLARTADR